MSADAPSPTPSERKIPIFGARRLARELNAELETLRRRVDELGLLSVIELAERRDQLDREISEQEARLRAEHEAAVRALDDETRAARAQLAELQYQLAELRAQVVTTEDTAMLQEVGIYEYRHPLGDAVAYQAELKALRDAIRTMARNDGNAITSAINWTVNGSVTEGRRMVRQTSKLMLRAYNAEADNLVRGMKPYRLASAIDRLNKAAAAIQRLGTAMQIEITSDYHRLRITELELTADYLARREEEKERAREERERLREEQRAQRELDAERRRLEKERRHYEAALEKILANGDEEGAARLRSQLEDVERAISDVDYRAANIRAGYVYVISNIGSFGPNMVKIGLTRRLDPLDRIRELGDASVPFRFDVHALFFSEDAVGIEAELHRRLADRRVNRVNQRREFFRATPDEVKQHLVELAGELLTYNDEAEALEYHQSVNLAGDLSVAQPQAL